MKNSQKFWKIGMATALATGSIVTVAPGVSAAATSFPDVQKGSTPYEAVMNLTERGIIDGFEDGTYRPGANVTRGQAAKLIVHALGIDTANVADPGFKDIPKSHRFYKEIAAMANAGYISGYKDGNFGSDDPLTRSQMLRILGESYEFGQAPLETNQFTDVDKDAYYAAYLQPLIDNGVTYGKTDTSFAPHQYVDRGQMALFIYRADEVKFGSSDVVKTSITKIEDGKVFTASGSYKVAANMAAFFATDNAAVLKNASVELRVDDGEVTGVSQLQLNTSGTSAAPLVFDAGGNTISGNVIVQADNVKVKDLTVNGNFTIGDKVQYSFEAEKLEVKGTTIITDGATASIAAIAKKASIVFNNVTLNGLQVAKKDVGVSFTNESKVKNIQITENAVIEADDSNKIDSVQIVGDVTEVEINADVETVEVKTTSEKLALNATGEIDTLDLAADVKIELSKDAQVGDLKLPEDVDAKDVIENYDDVKENVEEVGGEKNPDFKEPTTPPSSGGGSGGGGSSGGGGGSSGGGGGSSSTNVDYTATNDNITNISNNVTFMDGKFIVRSGVTKFTFKDGDLEVTASLVNSKWTFSTKVIELEPGNPTTPVSIVIDYPAIDEITVVTEGVIFADGQFTVPADVTEFIFNEGNREVTVTLNNGEWTFTTPQSPITPPVGTIFIGNGDNLVETVANATADTIIILTEDIIVDSPVVPAAGVTINGGGHTLTINTSGDGNSSAEGLHLAHDGITIKNITVTGTHEDHLIEIYRNATLDNVTVLDGEKAGIYVNNDQAESTVKVNFKDITTSRNGPDDESWTAGIGLVAQEAGSLVIANFEGENKFEESVGVYSDSPGEIYEGGYHGTVEVTGVLKGSKHINPDNNKDNWGVGTESAIFAGFLKDLEKAASGDTVEITSNITITQPVEINKGIILEGGNHTLLVKTKAKDNQTSGLGVVGVDKAVEIKDLTVKLHEDAPLSKQKYQEDEEVRAWNDNLIEIWNSKNVTLTNVTVDGNGNTQAGIYVNNDGFGKDMKVFFSGISTSGNHWAGIGLLAQKTEDKVTAIFTGENKFSEDTAVYSDNDALAGGDYKNEKYHGTVEVEGLDSAFTNPNDEKDNWGPAKTPKAAGNKLLADLAKATSGDTVTLSADAVVTEPIKPAAGVALDGNGKTLTINTSGAGGSSAVGLHLANHNITIKNITVTTDTHGDNLIEIYRNATLEKVTVENGEKAGIYVNNDQPNTTVKVKFKNITTSGNGWNAGIGLRAIEEKSKVIADFDGEHNFDEAVAVYTEGKYEKNSERYTVTGLDDYEISWIEHQKQSKWFTPSAFEVINAFDDSAKQALKLVTGDTIAVTGDTLRVNAAEEKIITVEILEPDEDLLEIGGTGLMDAFFELSGVQSIKIGKQPVRPFDKNDDEVTKPNVKVQILKDIKEEFDDFTDETKIGELQDKRLTIQIEGQDSEGINFVVYYTIEFKGVETGIQDSQ